MATKNIMRKFKILELSGVNASAQGPAEEIFLKAAPPETPSGNLANLSAAALEQRKSDVKKCYALVNPSIGRSGLAHAHLLDDTIQSGHTSYEDGHSHPFAKDPASGQVVVGAVDGHTHAAPAGGYMKIERNEFEFIAENRRQLAKAGVALPDGSFPITGKDDLTAAIGAFGSATDRPATAAHFRKMAVKFGIENLLPDTGELGTLLKTAQETTEHDSMTPEQLAAFEKMKQDLAKAEILAALNDAEKSFLKNLPVAEHDGFLKLDVAARGARIAESANSNPEVYKDLVGQRYFKNDDSRLIENAKRADNMAKAMAASAAVAERATFEKRASAELNHLPGDVEVKCAFLKALASISDEATRNGVTALVKAANDALSPAFQRRGTSAPSVRHASDPERQLQAIADEIRKADPKLTAEEAYAKALERPEADELYAKMIDAQKSQG